MSAQLPSGAGDVGRGVLTARKGDSDVGGSRGAGNPSPRNRSRRGTAALIESLILVFFLVAAFAVLLQAFARASIDGERGSQLTRAVELAAGVAEEFSADPADAPGAVTENELTATCEAEAEDTGAGTLWHAHITVRDSEGDEAYALSTSRYVPADGNGANSDDSGGPVVTSGNAGSAEGEVNR